MKSYVYILKCNDKSYYTGVSSDFIIRLQQHNSGFYPSCYTFKRRPLELVFSTEFSDITLAIAFEKKVKGWSRAKKLALIESRFEDLPNLSKKK